MSSSQEERRSAEIKEEIRHVKNKMEALNGELVSLERKLKKCGEDVTCTETTQAAIFRKKTELINLDNSIHYLDFNDDIFS